MATQHVQTLRAFRPHGPYRLGGTCNGGLVAFEMARQLVQAGEPVDRLLLIGSSAENACFRPMKKMIAAAGAMLRVPPRFQMALYEALRSAVLERSSRPLRGAAARLLAQLRRVDRARSTELSTSGEGETPQERRVRLRDTYLRIDRQYTPAWYANPVTLFWAAEDPEPAAQAARQWKQVAPKVDLHVVPGTHLGSLTEDLRGLAEHLKRRLG